ncbi:MAG: septum site-determining protein MinC [Azospirillaceae bacterium]|nr:septum site-determining protein MinC [Azospirillaceae bacterium]
MNNIQQNSERDGSFQLRGNNFTLMVLKLIDPGDPGFLPNLVNKIRQAPNFFRQAPVVLDLDDLVGDIAGLDFGRLVTSLREVNLFAVGILGGTAALQEQALRAGLTVLPAGRGGRVDSDHRSSPPAAGTGGATGVSGNAGGGDAGGDLPARAAMVIAEPVRSGRQVYAAKGDLIVLGPVSAGAELLADGHIHVYGALRGRALAGVAGDKTARIFCQSLEAELVSIAGLYRVSEDLDKSLLKKHVQIYLDSGYLRINALS